MNTTEIIERVVLVDEQDNSVGVEEKMKAHQLGLLHRAFSVFVYRYTDQGLEFLLQQRHIHKYHSGGLWTNTCCSHPRPGETVIEAAQRRLKEEMNLDLKLVMTGSFIYRSCFDNGLIEHELDHVLVGEYKQGMQILSDPTEVQNTVWKLLPDIQTDLKNAKLMYTPWFHQALEIAVGAL